MARTTFIGVCLTAFSFGIMGTIAIDHFWPRGRAECVGQVLGAGDPLPSPPAAPVVEMLPPPAPPAPAEPPAADPTPAAVPMPTAAPKAAMPRAAAPPKTAMPKAAMTRATMPKAAVTAKAATPKGVPPKAATQSPAARVAGTTSPAPLGAVAPREPAQGRALARKRPGTTASPSGNDRTLQPTDVWVDPFDR